MKKEIYSIAAWLLAFAAPFALLTACDDDDDSDDGSSYTTDGGESGTQLANIPAVVDASGVSCFIETIKDDDGGSYTITYDSDNLIESINDWTISYDPFKIIQEETDSYDEYTYTLGNFSFNSDGYITQFTSIQEETYTSSYYEEYYTDKLTTSCSYNSDGHISKLSISFYGYHKETEDGDTWSESSTGSGTVEFTWSGDKCTKVTISTSEDGDYYSGKASGTMTFTYDDTDCKQTLIDSYCYTELFEENLLACLGYFGAHGYLPATASYTYEASGTEYGEKFSWDDTYNFEYEYDIDNGKVYTSIDNYTYSYTEVVDDEEYSDSGKSSLTANYTYVGDSSSKSLSTKSVSLTEQPDETQVSNSNHRPRTLMQKIRERRQSHRNQSQTEE